LSNSTKVRHHNGVILHEICGQRSPGDAVLRISVNEHNDRPLSSPAHEDVRCFRAVNGFCLKTRWQRLLRVTDRRADSKKSDDEKTSNHDSSAVSKLQIGNGLVRISAGMVEISLHFMQIEA